MSFATVCNRSLGFLMGYVFHDISRRLYVIKIVLSRSGYIAHLCHIFSTANTNILQYCSILLKLIYHLKNEHLTKQWKME